MIITSDTKLIIARFSNYNGEYPNYIEFGYFQRSDFVGVIGHWQDRFLSAQISFIQYQKRIVALLSALARKRYLYIHVPKTGGTSLVNSLEQSRLQACFRINEFTKYSLDFFKNLIELCLTTGRLFVSGHIGLRHLGSYIVPEQGDTLITTYRPIGDLHVSLLNYLRQRYSDISMELENLAGCHSWMASCKEYELLILSGLNTSPETAMQDKQFLFVLCGGTEPYMKEQLVNVFLSDVYKKSFFNVFNLYFGLGDDPFQESIFDVLNVNVAQLDDKSRLASLLDLPESFAFSKLNETENKKLRFDDLMPFINQIPLREFEIDALLRARCD